MTTMIKERNKFSPFSSMRAVLDVVPRKRKREFLNIWLIMSFGALLEVATIGSILPFLSLISNSSQINKPIGMPYNITPEIAGIVFAFFVFLSGLMRVAIQKKSYQFTFAIGSDLGSALVDSALMKPYAWHIDRNSSDVLSGLQKINSVINNLLNPFMQASVSIVMSLSIILVVLFVSPTVAIFTIIVFGALYYMATFRSRNTIREYGLSIAKSEGARLQVVQESLGAIRYVILDKLMVFFSTRFTEIDKDMRNRQAHVSTLATAPRIFVESLGIILLILVSFWMSRQQGGIAAALPQLGAMAIGAQRLLPHMQSIYYCWSSLNSGQAQLDDVLSIISSPHQSDNKICRESSHVDRANIYSHCSELVLDDINFSYQNRKSVLSNINIHISAGSIIGIKGRTGSGKSTLIDLISGLLDPCKGQIYVTLSDNQKLLISDFQSRIAYVPQNIFISDSTVAENIALGQLTENIDRKRLIEMCKRAQILDDILAMPQQFETVVGENGARLSGGQRQRIGVARALYKSSEILILDEATSALDHVTERKLIQSIKDEGQDRIVIMVAHRLATLECCDRVFNLINGSLHEENS